MRRATAETQMTSFKCPKCLKNQIVRNIVQFPACLHVACSKCVQELEAAVQGNILCPQCNKENARPSVLRRISGLVDAPSDTVTCDECHGNAIAQWSCFNCGKNLCVRCRGDHPKEHSLQLLAKPADLTSRIFEAGDTGVISLATRVLDQADGTTGSASVSASLQCPHCGGVSCEHMGLLKKLMAQRPEDIGQCQQQGHVDDNGKKQELKFFCKVCWRPVCGDCSERGEHKTHETYDLFTMGTFLEDSLSLLTEKVGMLVSRCSQDVEEERCIEQRLVDHVKHVSDEMNDRKDKILEQTMQAFAKALDDGEKQGKDILREYREKVDQVEKFDIFLRRIQEILGTIKINAKELNVKDYVDAFYRQECAADLLWKMYELFKQIEKPEERRLVLPEVRDISSPPNPLTRVGTEWKALKLAFPPFQHHGAAVVHSIIADTEKCLLSCTRSREEQFDAIVHYKFDLEKKVWSSVAHDVHQGRYYIAQLESGELVASYASTAKQGMMFNTNYLQYSDGSMFDRAIPQGDNVDPGLVQFSNIRKFDFPPSGIAATKENTILLCANADMKKGASYLMLMSLQGKVLKETVKVPGENMISPNYVAVSDSGEICASDTEGSSIIILNKELEIQERMNFRLPASMVNAKSIALHDYKSTFQPHGICYDNYGRIIVADPENHCVVRLVRRAETREYKMEPLLTKSEDDRFSAPKLVGISKDSRLWVVCKDFVFVYDYCT